MSTIDDAFAQLWRAIKPDATLDTGAGLYKAWHQHYAEWGSPIQNEFTTDAGIPTQVFANAIVEWHPDGAHVVSG